MLAALAASVLVASACASRSGELADQASLPPPQLADTEVELDMPQTRLKLAYLDGHNQSMGISFGPLIDLIRYAVNYGAAKAEAQRNFRSLESLRDGASSAEVKQRVQVLLDEALAGVDWLASQPSTLVETVRADPEIDERAAATTADAYLRVQAVYAIDSDLHAVRVVLTADLRPRLPAGNTASGSASRMRPRWQQTQTVSAVLHLPEALSRAERETAWRQEDSRLLSESILRGTRIATQSLAVQLQTIAEVPQATGLEQAFVDPTGAVHSDHTPMRVIAADQRTDVHWGANTLTVYVPVQTSA